jgi:hypothetical protein
MALDDLGVPAIDDHVLDALDGGPVGELQTVEPRVVLVLKEVREFDEKQASVQQTPRKDSAATNHEFQTVPVRSSLLW